MMLGSCLTQLPGPLKVNSPRWVGKSVWRGRDSENISVETLALQHYETLGFKGSA